MSTTSLLMSSHPIVLQALQYPSQYLELLGLLGQQLHSFHGLKHMQMASKHYSQLRVGLANSGWLDLMEDILYFEFVSQADLEKGTAFILRDKGGVFLCDLGLGS